MAETDWDDPEVQGSWFAEQRKAAAQYLGRQGVPFGSLEPEPAWSVAPYVAFWRALGSRTGVPVYWVITGDLPSDFLPSEAAATPRDAAAAFAERWRAVATCLRAGKEHRSGGQTLLPAGRRTTTTGEGRDWCACSPAFSGHLESATCSAPAKLHAEDTR